MNLPNLSKTDLYVRPDSMTNVNPVVKKNIEEMFKLIESTNNKQPDSITLDSDLATVSQKMDPETVINKAICRMIHVNLADFYDDIYIPFSFFRSGDWKISKILYDNEDSLFYNELFLPEQDRPRFYEIFDKYVEMIEDIMSENNKLFRFLKMWTDTTGYKWRVKNISSHLKTTLEDPQYQMISPAHVASIYQEMNDIYGKDVETLKGEFKKRLDKIISMMNKEIRIFKRIFDNILIMYVYEQPLDDDSKEVFMLAFMNSILLAIMDFIEKLLSLNIYAINSLVDRTIGYYVPLNVINSYNRTEYEGRKLVII